MTDEHNTQLKIKQNLSGVKHKIVVLSGKGGVGKSTVSANLAIGLSEIGYNVGLIDCDIHGPSIPKILGVEDKIPMISENRILPVSVNKKLNIISIALLSQSRDSPVIWRGPIKMGIIKQFLGDVAWGNLDYLIFDLPPGTGDEPLSLAQLISNNSGAIIVTTPQDIALLSVRKSINFVKKMNIPIIGIIENMSGLKCPYCDTNIDLFKTGGGIKTSKDFNVKFLGKIPLDLKIVEAGDSGKTFLNDNEKSDASNAFMKIIRKIEKIEKLEI